MAWNTKLWEGASAFIRNMCGTIRTSGSCRTRVNRDLRQRFQTPKVAEEFYESVSQPSMSCPPNEENRDDIVTPDIVMQSGHGSQDSATSVTIETIDTLAQSLQDVCQLEPEQHLHSLCTSFASYCSRMNVSVPMDFIEYAVKGMLQLESSKRSNILYALAKGLGTQRPCGTDSLFPTKRVITGLIEYSINFFCATTSAQVSCPKDYRLWLQTMYSLFGNKWLNLHGDPMWKIENTEQGESLSSSNSRLTNEARVNIPAISARTIQRDIQKSSFTTGANIQEGILDEAVKGLPDADWWIKSDGCDVIAGLTESMRLEWSGDVDFGDGLLQKQYGLYIERVDLVKRVNRQLHIAQQRKDTLNDLNTIKLSLQNDLAYLPAALKKANDDCSEKFSGGKTSSDKEMFSLCWTVDELNRLNDLGRDMYVEVTSLVELLVDEETDVIQHNVARRISKLQERLLPFIREVTRHQRQKATHILVTMISPSQRSQKPYALPISCIPYHSLTIKQARTHINGIISEMKKRNMNIAGFVSNGEYNAFRSTGYTRPLSVLSLRSLARNKYTKMSEAKMEAMLCPIVKLNGNVEAKVPNQCVSQDLLDKIHSWKLSGASNHDVLDRLRLQSVPIGYSPKPWNAKRPTETYGDKLRSILAQLEYTYQVLEYDKNGVPFRTFMYVPEIHPITGHEYHEREDDAHILKRIATATRAGGPNELKLERFAEALKDPKSGLTYPALTGQRKQSVRDAERLFSEGVAKFMEKHQYSYEAKFVRTVLNWRRASDERGLTELQRCHYNYDMLNFLLDDLMPWHKDIYDFSTLEVNRDINGIQGLTRQTLIALTTTIESREWMRRKLGNNGLPAEHPRASNTDDVECFFSLLRDMIGNHFTCKTVMTEWRKVCLEFSKRIDRDLPFYSPQHTRDFLKENARVLTISLSQQETQGNKESEASSSQETLQLAGLPLSRQEKSQFDDSFIIYQLGFLHLLELLFRTTL